MSYTHLSHDERYRIQHLHRGGSSTREIGVELKRASTTISRELRRNPGEAARYHARTAPSLAAIKSGTLWKTPFKAISRDTAEETFGHVEPGS